MELVKDKPLSAISICEITSKAGVSRMTYYRNYSSKEEIFEKYMQQIVKDFEKETSQGINYSKENSVGKHFAGYDNIRKCFTYFERYQDFIRCLIKVGMSNILLKALSEYVIGTYYNSNDDKLYFTLIAYAGSLFNVYVVWLENGCKASVDDMAEIVYEIYKN